MQAVVLAAGEGSRLGPIASVVPKPLLPIGGVPLVVRIVDKLRDEGFKPILVCVNEAFEDQFAYHLEPDEHPYLTIDARDGPKGTAGELLSRYDLLEDEFLVYYADVWTDHDLGRFLGEWKSTTGVLVALAVSRRLRVEKGVPRLEDEDRWSPIVELLEKPEIEVPNLAGIGIFRKEVLKHAHPGEDLNAHVIPRAIAAGAAVYGYVFTEGYDDIGSLHAYRQVDAKFRGK